MIDEYEFPGYEEIFGKEYPDEDFIDYTKIGYGDALTKYMEGKKNGIQKD